MSRNNAKKYQQIKVNNSNGQLEKIKKAIENGVGTNLKLSHSDINGEHVLAVTNLQLNKISKAYEKGTGVVIHLSKTQLMHNSQIEGGFIGALLPLLGAAGSFLLKSVVPSLATGLLAGVGSSAGSAMVDKIAGRGVNEGIGPLRANTIYIKNRGKGIKMTAAGSGLYMRPWNKGEPVMDGMYLRSGSGYSPVGSGLLLGPNSPFASIPFLNILF